VRTVSPGARGRRTWPQRLLLSLNLVLIIAALGTAAALGFSYEKVGSLPRIDLGDALEQPAASDGEEGPGPVNVLLVGTDSSSGLDPDDPVNEGRPSSKLADVIMILRMEPDTGDAALLSVPRDLWVPIAGTESSNKINAAYSAGGPATLIQTIDEFLGIPIHHFVEVDFVGFRSIVAAIDGVDVYFPYPSRDTSSLLDIPEAGCQRLDEVQALALARSRHFETYRDGRWSQDERYDFGRMQRQQEFIRIALSRAIDRGIRNPATANALLNALSDSVLLDDELTTGMILDIGNAFRLFDPENLGGYTLEDFVVNDWKGGQLALVLQEGAAEPVLELFRGTAGLDPTPGAVRIRVVNGTGERNQAGAVRDDLELAGFVVRATDNADEQLTRTEVRYAPGQRASADLLARYLASPPELVEVPGLTGAPVELATGTDYAGMLAEPRDPVPGTSSSTTSTTTPPTSDQDGDVDDDGGEPAGTEPDSEAPRGC
jgi:polyisoprenyl-teichoic acid--peptidoglycan teichoic acid transferase